MIQHVRNRDRHRDVRPLILVLKEATEKPFPKDHVPVAALLVEGERPAVKVILKRRKRKSASRIRVVIEAAAAEIGDVESGLERMFAVNPRDDIVKDEVILGLQPVALCPAARERIEHNDLRAGLDADRRCVLPCDEDTELIHNGAGKRRLLSVEKLIFAIVKIRCSLRQRDAAHPLILY